MYSVTGGGRETAAGCRRAALGSLHFQNTDCTKPRLCSARRITKIAPAYRVSDLGNVNIDHNAYIGGFKSGEITWLGIQHTLLGPRSEVPKINRIVRSNCTKNTQTDSLQIWKYKRLY